MLPKWFAQPLWLLLLAGCVYPVREQADLAVCELAAHDIDAQTPAPLPDQKGPDAAAPSSTSAEEQETGPMLDAQPGGQRPPAERARTLLERLKLPPDIPGANAPPILLPRFPGINEPNREQLLNEREQAINRLFPPLPVLGPDPKPEPGPEGRPLTLGDLQRLALANSPLLRQAASDVEAAKGAAIQAGAYPNPNMGYQFDTAGTGGTAGYQGAFLEQTIKTGNKLKLAQAAATMDLLNSQLALRRAQTDLMAQVRGGYFAVLVAAENVKVSDALARFTDESYRIQVEQVRASPAAPYEPMQLRVLSYQARGAVVLARNRYVSAWKQLAATLGLPGLPLTELTGQVDMPIPRYQHDKVLARVLSGHTDVRTAQNTIQKQRYNLRLAQVTPVSDVTTHLAIEKDYTVPPFSIVSSLQMGVALPLWDRNKGNIIQAQGNLLRAIEEPHRVRTDLTTRVADAFERYENNRILLEYYRNNILPDQVRAYQGVRLRHNLDPSSVAFGDVVTAQQTLALTVTTYVTALGAQWQAVVDVASLLQTDELFGAEGTAGTEAVAAVADLEHLMALPCCHPCNSLPDPALKGADGRWPAAIAGLEEIPATPRPGSPSKSPGSDYEVLPLPPTKH